MDDRISNFANRRDMHGDTLFSSMRLVNIAGMLQDFNLYDCYKEDLTDDQKDVNVRIAKFSQKLDLWGFEDIKKLYEGNMLKPERTIKSELMKHFKTINQNLCAAYKIIYQ